MSALPLGEGFVQENSVRHQRRCQRRKQVALEISSDDNQGKEGSWERAGREVTAPSSNVKTFPSASSERRMYRVEADVSSEHPVAGPRHGKGMTSGSHRDIERSLRHRRRDGEPMQPIVDK